MKKKKPLFEKIAEKRLFFFEKNLRIKIKPLEPFVWVENHLKKTLEEKDKNHSKKKTL